jgi:hypothetical protein
MKGPSEAIRKGLLKASSAAWICQLRMRLMIRQLPPDHYLMYLDQRGKKVTHSYYDSSENARQSIKSLELS